MSMLKTTSKTRKSKAAVMGSAVLAMAFSGLAMAGPPGAVGDVYVVGSWINANGNTAPAVTQYDGVTGAEVGRLASRMGGQFNGMTWGPDGNLYASQQLGGSGRWRIAQFDGQTGDFIQNVINVVDAGFSVAKGLVFGPDGDLYVGDFFAQRIIRYDGTTFVEKSSTPTGEIVGTPNGMHFAPNGNLFVLSGGFNAIKEYDVSAGGVTFLGIFANIPGAVQPQDFTWGPNGNIFVTRGSVGGVAEVDGTTGAFIANFTPPDSSMGTNGLAFDDYGRFLVSIIFPDNQVVAYDATTGVLAGPFITPGGTLISIKQGPAGGCSAADLAEPYGQLDFFDVSAFLSLFTANDPAADLNGDGAFNFFDVSTFLSVFSAGCP